MGKGLKNKKKTHYQKATQMANKQIKSLTLLVPREKAN